MKSEDTISKTNLNIAMLGHKRIPSREGGVEIVVEELSTRMAKQGHNVTCFNRSIMSAEKNLTQKVRVNIKV